MNPHALGAILLVAASASNPIVSWVSSPLNANDTAIVLGGGFDPTSAVVHLSTLSSTPFVSVVITPVPGHTTEGSLKFTVPEDFPEDAWELRIVNNGTGLSSGPWALNTAQPWWVQGDCGDTATPGGWLRVFGTSISSTSETVTKLRRRIRDLRDAISSPKAAADDAAGDDSAVVQAAVEILDIRSRLAGLPQPQTTLRLTSLSSGLPVYINATAANASKWSAYFPLPAGLALGDYNVSVSNGNGGVTWAFTALDSFITPDMPHASSITIAPPRSWPGVARFTVATRSLPCRQPCNTSDDALSAALEAAATSGGGTVYFPRGQYFLTRAVIVPPFTVLAGEREDLVALYFAEDTNETAPPSYFSPSIASNSTTTMSWGVQDLTVYVSAYHHNIFDAGNTTDGFFLRRIRTRINAFFGQVRIESTRGCTPATHPTSPLFAER